MRSKNNDILKCNAMAVPVSVCALSHSPLAVNVDEPLNDLPCVGAHNVLTQSPKARDKVGQRAARNKLEEDEQAALVFTIVVVAEVLNDVGVAQALIQGELLHIMRAVGLQTMSGAHIIL